MFDITKKIGFALIISRHNFPNVQREQKLTDINIDFFYLKKSLKLMKPFIIIFGYYMNILERMSLSFDMKMNSTPYFMN